MVYILVFPVLLNAPTDHRPQRTMTQTTRYCEKEALFWGECVQQRILGAQIPRNLPILYLPMPNFQLKKYTWITFE